MIECVRKAVFPALILVSWPALRADGANSVFHQGITWTFSSDRPTGQFANGEPWVVGPVTITAISPNPSQSVTGVQNGSMKNPIPARRQGFENNAITGIAEINYDPSLNVALQLPLTLAGNDALVSSITMPANAYPNYIDTICILTILPSAPPAGSFRPGFYGADHTVRFNKSQINYGVLKNLPNVAGAPTQAQVEAKLPSLPWFEWHGHQAAGLYNAWRNMAAGNGGDGKPSTYGREIAHKWGDVALWLQLSNTQADKEKAMIQTIQCGIDIHSYVTHGGGYYHDGGHKSGRKFPVFLAAVALNDPTLLQFAANPDVFQEDTTTFFVTQADVDRVRGDAGAAYTSSQLGMPEWGIRHRWEPIHDDSRWPAPPGVYYRHVNWPANAGSVLAADLMGRKDAWGHPAIFAYNDRYRAMGGISGFTANMYAYKSGGINPPPTGDAPGLVQNFAITSTVAPQTASWTGEAGTLQTHIFLLNPSTNQWAFHTNADGNQTTIQLSLPAGTHTLRAARQNSETWSENSAPVTVTVPSSSTTPSRPTGLRVVE